MKIIISVDDGVSIKEFLEALDLNEEFIKSIEFKVGL